MPVFTEGKGVKFPRWQIEDDPSLMLMQIDAPTDAEHPDVSRYAHMLSVTLPALSTVPGSRRGGQRDSVQEALLPLLPLV